MPKSTHIPLLDLSYEYSLLKKDIQAQINQSLKSQEWILGKKVLELEQRVAKYLGVRFAVGVASGTDALLLSLRALAMKRKRKGFFGRGDEIITSAFTFVATAESIVRSGAKVVFCDVDPNTFNIDPDKVRGAVNKNTVGILPVHLYGLACQMQPILKVAKDKGLFVVEDAAQSFGGSYKNKKLGSFGATGALSFFPSKNLASFGDAGLVSTNDASLAKILKVLRNHGQTSGYNADYIAYNSRLDALQAGVLLAKLKYIDKFNRLRKEVSSRYTKSLGSIDEVVTPFVPKATSHAWCLYTIKVLSKRDKLCRFLNSKGVGARIYYPIPLYKMKAFKDARCSGSLKETRKVSSQVLSLPIHPFLKKKQIDYITLLIKKFFKVKS
jgi:dTDP-4-amino-4,6-dideoxygalactose transaminase